MKALVDPVGSFAKRSNLLPAVGRGVAGNVSQMQDVSEINPVIKCCRKSLFLQHLAWQNNTNFVSRLIPNHSSIHRGILKFGAFTAFKNPKNSNATRAGILAVGSPVGAAVK